jgi:hypothetical protein
LKEGNCSLFTYRNKNAWQVRQALVSITPRL